MFKNFLRRSSVKLKMNASYNEDIDKLYLSPNDKNMSESDFRIILSDRDNETYLLRKRLEKRGVIPENLSRSLPEEASLPNNLYFNEWDKVPIGTMPNNNHFIWTPAISPHIFLGGNSLTKDMVQENLILHCARHPERWKFFGIDLLQVDIAPYSRLDAVTVVKNVEDGVAIIRNVYHEMENRVQLMADIGVTDFQEIPGNLPSIMVMVDESYMFFASTGIKTDEGIASDVLKQEGFSCVEKIAKLGASTGIHLVLASRRMDAIAQLGLFDIADFPTRIADRSLNGEASFFLFGNEKSRDIPPVPGRGYFNQLGAEGYFQAFVDENSLLSGRQ